MVNGIFDKFKQENKLDNGIYKVWVKGKNKLLRWERIRVNKFILGGIAFILVLVTIVSLPQVAGATQVDPRIRSGSEYGAYWREEVRQEQRNPESHDQRHWVINVRLESTRPPQLPEHMFQNAKFSTRYKLPFGVDKTGERETNWGTYISYSDSTYRSTHADVEAEIIRTLFDWNFQYESPRSRHLGRVIYSFKR